MTPRAMALALSLVVGGCALAEDLPHAVDLRPQFEASGLTVRSQAPRGCCSLFAIVAVLEYELAQCGEAVRLSPEYLNWASHQTNGRRTDGSFFSDAVRGVRLLGVCQESLFPYATEFDARRQPSEEAVREGASRKDISARWIKHWDVKTGMTEDMLGQMRRELAEGHPVAIGMRWPKKERYGEGNVLALPPGQEVFDGHSVALVGYREDARLPGGGAFLFRNSFGPGWRSGGYAWLPFAYAAAYGNDALTLRIGGAEPLLSNRAAVAPLEAETLKVLQRQDCRPGVQKMTPWGAALWSGGAQLFCGANEGSWVALGLPVQTAGRRRISLFATRAPDFGVVRVYLDGKAIGQELDLYGPEVTPSGRLPLGEAELGEGDHELRIEVVGRNRAATGGHFGIDCLELQE